MEEGVDPVKYTPRRESDLRVSSSCIPHHFRIDVLRLSPPALMRMAGEGHALRFTYRMRETMIDMLRIDESEVRGCAGDISQAPRFLDQGAGWLVRLLSCGASARTSLTYSPGIMSATTLSLYGIITYPHVKH